MGYVALLNCLDKGRDIPVEAHWLGRPYDLSLNLSIGPCVGFSNELCALTFTHKHKKDCIFSEADHTVCCMHTLYGLGNFVVTIQFTCLWLEARAHYWCGHTVWSDCRANWPQCSQLYVWERLIKSCWKAWLLTFVNIDVKAERWVCLLATVLSRQKFVLFCVSKPQSRRGAGA